MQHQQIGGHGNRLAHGFGIRSFGQRSGGRLGGLLASAGEDCPSQLFEPAVVGLAVAKRLAQQTILVQQSRQDLAHRGPRPAIVTQGMFGIHTVTNRLTQQRVRELFAGQLQHRPGSPSQYDAMHVHFILNGELQMIECLSRRSFRHCCEVGLGAFPIDSAHGLTQHLPTAAQFDRLRRLVGWDQASDTAGLRRLALRAAGPPNCSFRPARCQLKTTRQMLLPDGE